MCCSLVVKQLGLCDYQPTFVAMQEWTQQRQDDTVDQLWLCQHNPVFTQGKAGKAEHILNSKGIAVVATNRGGQVTYHGPGQIVAYPLIDLRRKSYLIKQYVWRLEQAVINTLAEFSVQGLRVTGAPGIYVQLPKNLINSSLHLQNAAFSGLAKIAALGVKVQKYCTYHGVALNVAMDLAPFSQINPCGYAGLQTTDMAQLGINASCEQVSQELQSQLQRQLV